MYQISKEYHFCAAHRLEGHPKCGRLHGHNYKVIVTVFSHTLNDGMVLDYHSLDTVVKPVVDGMDHKYLVSRENELNCPYLSIAHREEHDYPLPCDRSTAERIAEHIHSLLTEGMFVYGFDTMSVEVQETPKVTAVYSR